MCKSIPPLEDLHENHHGVFTHHTYEQLHASAAAAQCDLCSMIWESLHGLGSTEKIMAEEPDKISVILGYQGSANWDRIHLSPDIHREAGSMLELFTKRGKFVAVLDAVQLTIICIPNMRLTKPMTGEKSQRAITRKGLASSHNSHQTYEFIRGAVQECLNNHKQCSENTHVELPTFLVDVGLCHNKDHVRLVRNGDTCKGNYLAMSYCWGGPQRVMLTTKTLRPFQDKLTTSSLPEAIKDAIYVTRELGHRYLWIDALCIIQNDDRFKQVELLKMNRIYQNAFLTIQPTWSATVEEGFLDGRITTPFVKMALRHDIDGTQVYVYARPVMPAWGNATQGPTVRRAWIFQETALSTRLVAYSSHQVIVACQTLSHSENSENGISASISLVGPGLCNNIRPDLYTATSSLDLMEARKVSLSGWYKTVGMHYTGRLYTVGKDRLYALSAFAEEAQKLIGGEYLAGIWSVDLIRGLTWSARNGRPLGRSSHYRAPSWSWAAFDGQVLWIKDISHIEATTKETRVVEAWVTPEGINPYGPCLEGKVILEALVGVASVSAKLWFRGKSMFKGQFILSTADGTQDLCHAHFDTAEEPETFICVFLTSEKGLLLVAQDSNFRRVGRFGLGDAYIKTGGTQGFQAWRDSCEYKTIAIV
ncbi:hypothetical protein G7054_g13012 [Neopestalotiopsis clavispora]|nr:hypothetical protein G7054_g13012 [Neopestalotiopsis clavispora]